MEQTFVAWAKMRAHRLPKVKLGIGDDAAVLDGSLGDVVVTTDSFVGWYALHPLRSIATSHWS